ncbi:Na+/H+ antiporter subunit D [Paenibacillus crassostreae]|uniref:Cation:proton antiporter n=1 Tax=Paenibacillus crassostreae TaxID=1763538 RepID=A0A167ADC8_9BACL|nr:Na+/H+ antiporter subunit D [Paenibacillus crassostreae]AOZ92414.1 Na+/H+ antiporter subunit D [Paenibacillus crassostreae]OAB70875.1 cation:proton antiporter [Paenibacillus crassostreae]
MSNLPVFPILIPLCTAVILMFLKDKIAVQRFISALSAILNIGVCLILVNRIDQNGIQTLNMGGWMPPYGIVFVADMFAALLVLTASIVSFAILLYSFRSIGVERERTYYYTFFHFLLVGVYGSFLTGDIFNLFVFFEVMLISSYALISLGGTKLQLRETVKYLLINIVSSTLFVAAVAYLYAAVGTLNMAHLSLRVAELGQGGVLNVIAMMFLIVFSLKSGLLLFFWLPGSYAAPPSAVRALFGALLTKVGLYAIFRTFTLIFYHDPGLTHTWIAWMAAATMILGGIGAVAYNDIARILNYNVIISVGFVAFGLAAATGDSLDGAVFYLMHDMLAKGLMFILGGIIISIAGTDRLKDMGGLIKRYPFIGWMFFTLALALVGIPPLSGFAGKVLLIRGGLDAGMLTMSLIGLASSLLVLYSLMKVFRLAFWGDEKEQVKREPIKLKGVTVSVVGLLVLIILMGFGSEWVYSYVSQAGDVLANPTLYIEAVMKE